MSIPRGTLTSEFCEELLAFYSQHFGWTELESLRRPDRLTIAVGDGDYVNVREMDDCAAYTGYEHFGLRMPSSASVDEAWAALRDDRTCEELEPLEGTPGGYRHFRFRHLIPLTVEVQYLPEG
jgi:hypothetical protein